MAVVKQDSERGGYYVEDTRNPLPNCARPERITWLHPTPAGAIAEAERSGYTVVDIESDTDETWLKTWTNGKGREYL